MVVSPARWTGQQGKCSSCCLGHTFTLAINTRFTFTLCADAAVQVDLVMPQDQWQAVQERLVGNVPAPEFCRVTMTLLQILRGDFFTEYIKIGDIVMLSRGRNGLDNVFTLKDGQLTMCLDKETYERAGLVGKPHGAKGNRGLRPRWVVEFDLRSPSMLHGRPGFDRLVYACKNTLTEPLTWLFCNVSNKSEPRVLFVCSSSYMRPMLTSSFSP